MVGKEGNGRPLQVCPECGWVAGESLPLAAGVLVQRDGALLLIRHDPQNEAFPGAWHLPAGYCAAGGSTPATVARQAAEKTGLALRIGRLVDAYSFVDDPLGKGLLLAYEAEIASGELQDDATGAVTFAFFPPGQLPTPLGGGGHDQAILAWQLRALDRWQPGSAMRYCPHCAHALEVRMAFARMRSVCPACGFVHFQDPKVGVSALIEEEHRVLLIQRAVDPARGNWCLPSGFVEWDEAPQTAVVRECVEETGLVVAHLELVDVRHYTDDFRGPGINLTYRAQVVGGSLRPGDDAAQARFFDSQDLPPLDAVAFLSHRLILRRWLERYGHLSPGTFPIREGIEGPNEH